VTARTGDRGERGGRNDVRRAGQAVRVEAPARLHLGMLAVAGDGERRFGGFGVSVSRPAVVLEAEPADELSADGPDAGRALEFARRCRDALGLAGGARLRVVEAIPPHVGLGSGTKLALAVAHALAAVHGRTYDAPVLAEAVGRAARSAVGMWTFALGGLVVEGGVRRGVARPAPLLMRHAVPEEWRIVLVVPSAEPGLSGVAEEEAFGRLVPSAERSAAIAQLVLTSLLPALVERDVEEFGAAVTRVQQLVGDSFAAVQGGRFHPRAGPLVEALLGHGAAGAGQSSWGPAVYGVVGSEAAGRELAQRMEDVVGENGSVELVTFANSGARVEGA
jgi:beta-RFAP synthase